MKYFIDIKEYRIDLTMVDHYYPVTTKYRHYIKIKTISSCIDIYCDDQKEQQEILNSLDNVFDVSYL